MLYSIDDTTKPIANIPHEKAFMRWRSRLSDEEYAAINAELEIRVGNGDILTSSWVPGSDWTGTPFDPIYTKACQFDELEAALCFGLFVWVFMQSHPAAWSFGRYQKDGLDIRGLTYFQIQP